MKHTVVRKTNDCLLTRWHESRCDTGPRHSRRSRRCVWSAGLRTVSRLSRPTCCTPSRTKSHYSACPPRRKQRQGCTVHIPSEPTCQCPSLWRYHLKREKEFLWRSLKAVHFFTSSSEYLIHTKSDIAHGRSEYALITQQLISQPSRIFSL